MGPWAKEVQAEEANVEESRQQVVSEGHSLPGRWLVPLFKAVRAFLPTHRTRAGLLGLKRMKEESGPDCWGRESKQGGEGP